MFSLRCLQEWNELGGGDNSANTKRCNTQWTALNLASTERRLTTWYQSRIHLPTRSRVHRHPTAKSSCRVSSRFLRQIQCNSKDRQQISKISLHWRCFAVLKFDVKFQCTRQQLDVTAATFVISLLWMCETGEQFSESCCYRKTHHLLRVWDILRTASKTRHFLITEV